MTDERRENMKLEITTDRDGKPNWYIDEIWASALNIDTDEPCLNVYVTLPAYSESDGERGDPALIAKAERLAHLIAAAPRLYAALERAHCVMAHFMPTVAGEEITEAEAALAAARREKP